MRALILPITFLLLSCQHITGANQSTGYVLVDFYSIDDKMRKSYWLGVCDGERIRHLHTKYSVNKLPVGEYKLHHLDKVGNFCIRYDDLLIESEELPSFAIRQDSINYLGVVTLEKRGEKRQYRLNFATGGGILQRACKENSHIFTQYSVRYALTGLEDMFEFEYDCESNSVNDLGTKVAAGISVAR